MKLIIEIDLLNDAFQGDMAGEVGHILHKVISELYLDHTESPLLDSNGHKVGYFQIVPEQLG